eukprot:CAMPEP_0184694536 /NCGR_PEP_ID=MMETSP0313-20130426/2451_1 /TAXON_ID=2792 /ORGANISM="Porphyridium aerugineum, Strain SAG 1380-2" /LENGTH=476 /DNA_ID=CAMNT_0027152833 /DNA_START=482 /DNA_END=1911 /DNA_ORIENTATION=-
MQAPSYEELSDKSEREYDDLGTDEGSDSQKQSEEAPEAADDEIMFYVCHSLTEDYCLATVTDHRLPLTFLEKASAPVDALRRTIGMKLKDIDIPEAFVIAHHYWLENGRSTLTFLCYTLEPEVRSEKYFLLLEKYPTYRFPRASDVIETLTGIEEDFCGFCARRGFPTCECPRPMVERLRLAVPPKSARDPWSLQVWGWRFEHGVRKYRTTLKNYPSGAEHVLHTYHTVTSMVGGDLSYSKGFEYYLNELKPYVTSQIVGKSSRLLSASKLPSTKYLASNEYENVDLNVMDDFANNANSSTNDEWHVTDKAFVEVLDGFEVDLDQFHDAAQESIHLGPQLDRCSGRDSEAKEAENTKEAECAGVTSSSDIRKSRKRKRKYESQDDGSMDDSEQQALLKAYLDSIDGMEFPGGQRKQCGFCSTFFTRKHDLKRHIITKHMKTKVFRCLVCNAKFTRQNHVSGHMKRRHDMISISQDL